MQSGASITASSKVIKTIATSSTHAEIHALFHSAKDMMSTRRLLEELGFPQTKPTAIYEDNSACVMFAESLKVKQRTKHVEIKYLCIKQLVAWGKIPGQDRHERPDRRLPHQSTRCKQARSFHSPRPWGYQSSRKQTRTRNFPVACQSVLPKATPLKSQEHHAATRIAGGQISTTLFFFKSLPHRLFKRRARGVFSLQFFYGASYFLSDQRFFLRDKTN